METTDQPTEPKREPNAKGQIYFELIRHANGHEYKIDEATQVRIAKALGDSSPIKRKLFFKKMKRGELSLEHVLKLLGEESA